MFKSGCFKNTNIHIKTSQQQFHAIERIFNFFGGGFLGHVLMVFEAHGAQLKKSNQ
jgi:hypothetical protein